MRNIETTTRIRTAPPLLFSILLVMFTLVFILPNRALAQESNGIDKVEAISKRLEELEKQMESLKRENAELKKKFDEKGAPKEALAEVKETPAPDSREVATAQQENEPQKKDKRIEVGGQIMLRPELRNNDLIIFANNNFFVRQRVRLNVKAKLSEDLTAFAEVQDARFWGQAFSTIGNVRNIDLHQAYLQIDNVLTRSLSLKVGRQELSYGNERLIGAFDWDNVGRSFDGIKAVYAKDSWSADLFATRVADLTGFFFPIPRVSEQPLSSVDDDDDVELDPLLFSDDQDLYGAYLKFFKDNPKYKLELYGLFLRDGSFIRGETGRGRGSSSLIYTMGTRQEVNFDSGIYYEGEVAFQTGNRGRDDHRALALAARLGKNFKISRSPRFGFEYDFATGDDNFMDGESREFINLFADNHTHYGYIDYLGWRNMHDFKLSFGFNPASKLSFNADYHKFLLHKASGRWSDAAGFNLGFSRNGNFGREIGQELDFTLRFPYKEHLNFLTGYSLFMPGRFAKLTRSSEFSHFSYIQTRINF
jgi:Alginate export